MSGTATIPNTQSGTSSLRSRCPITSTSGSCWAELAIIEPPIPNSTPHAGNSDRYAGAPTSVAITRPSAATFSRSSQRSRPVTAATGAVSDVDRLSRRRCSSLPLSRASAEVWSLTAGRASATEGCFGNRLFSTPMRFIRCQRTATPLTALATERMSTEYISCR